jgi:TonB family protein
MTYFNSTPGHRKGVHLKADAKVFLEDEKMNSKRLQLSAAILAVGLALSVAVNVAVHAETRQADNNNSLAKSTRKKTARHGVRRARRRAAPSRAANVSPGPKPMLMQPPVISVKTPRLPLGGVDIDPQLYKDLPYARPSTQKPKPQAQKDKTAGGGIGTGYGVGSGQGDGPGRGSNVGNGSDVREREGGTGSGGVVGYGRVFTARDVDRKARLVSRPEPMMTEEAKLNNVQGNVVLRMTLTADGKVTNIRVIAGLPYGLSEKAVEAARQIKFEPAMKDGRAVSQYIQIEYNFNTY